MAPKPNTRRPAPEHKIYPYLLRGLQIERPDQVWCADITYIRLVHGFVYLTAVMDWYSRYVLAWEVSVTMQEEFCVSALESALRRHGCPQIFNTDQGSQFTGETFTGVLKDAKVDISMDGKGRAMDNIMVERLWRSAKYEEVYLKDYESVTELVAALRRTSRSTTTNARTNPTAERRRRRFAAAGHQSPLLHKWLIGTKCVMD